MANLERLSRLTKLFYCQSQNLAREGLECFAKRLFDKVISDLKRADPGEEAKNAPEEEVKNASEEEVKNAPEVPGPINR